MKKLKTIKEKCEYLFYKKKYRKIDIARELNISHSTVYYHLNKDYKERHKKVAMDSYVRTKRLLEIKAKKILKSYPQKNT